VEKMGVFVAKKKKEKIDYQRNYDKIGANCKSLIGCNVIMENKESGKKLYCKFKGFLEYNKWQYIQVYRDALVSALDCFTII